MRSPFARRMFMFSFFSTWASRMLGHVSSQLLDPTLRTFRFLKRGDISGAASTLQKTFENQEFRALMGGLINSYRDMYIIQSSLGADDRSLDSFWALGQSTAYLAPALFPGLDLLLTGIEHRRRMMISMRVTKVHGTRCKNKSRDCELAQLFDCLVPLTGTIICKRGNCCCFV